MTLISSFVIHIYTISLNKGNWHLIYNYNKAQHDTNIIYTYLYYPYHRYQCGLYSTMTPSMMTSYLALKPVLNSRSGIFS